MATIGLDRLYYSKITEDSNGEETYATPLVLAKANHRRTHRWNWWRQFCTLMTVQQKL